MHHPWQLQASPAHDGRLARRRLCSSGAAAPTLDVLPLADAVKGYTTTPLLYDPGTGYTDSNAGINAASRIIEVVSGMPCERFLQERVFDPLGMPDTTFGPTAAQVKRLAKA